ncbi:hypothetical protein [Verminephrobacter eiseniae]|uniref:hypothetical protein n=1 Tax=Verminephrobacter eiseniae TaxID=364317 RepID=UPI00223914A2|nr:hypothetical protein [Verminephrobacter eiseniae]
MPSRFQQRRRARGWFLISAMLGLTILSLAALYLFREQHARTQAALAQVQADTIGAIRTAAEILVFEHYADYQQGNGLTRGSVSLVSRHRSDVVGCAQPSERSARRIAQPIPSVLASDATLRCASMASADRQMIGDATLVHRIIE